MFMTVKKCIKLLPKEIQWSKDNGFQLVDDACQHVLQDDEKIHNKTLMRKKYKSPARENSNKYLFKYYHGWPIMKLKLGQSSQCEPGLQLWGRWCRKSSCDRNLTLTIWNLVGVKDNSIMFGLSTAQRQAVVSCNVGPHWPSWLFR